MLAKQPALLTFEVGYHVQGAVEHVRPRCLTRMHPRSEDDHFLVLFEAERALCRIFLSVWIHTHLIVGTVGRYVLPLVKNAIL